MFLISIIQEFFFSLYSSKQVFENKKQKLLPNITFMSIFIYMCLEPSYGVPLHRVGQAVQVYH